MDWFLYDNGLRHERAKETFSQFFSIELTFQLGNSNRFLYFNIVNDKEMYLLLPINSLSCNFMI